MRLGFDAGPIVGGAGGVKSHTVHLLRALLTRDPTLEVVAYVPSGSRGQVDAQAWSLFPHLQWREVGRWGWQSQAVRDRLDLFHGPNFKMRAEGRFGGIVTIHDLWLERHPEYSGKLLGQWWSGLRTRRTAWRAQRVITVSQFSKREMMDLYGLPADRIEVIPNGVDREYWDRYESGAAEALRRRLKIPDGPYLLFVGGADPRKNHRTVLEAYAGRRDRLRPWKLVMVGDPVHRFGNYHESIVSAGLQGDVILVGRMGAEDLRVLYQQATLLLFPSLYEGFGIPVLEAMASGTPVITSSTTSLPEVAGEAAVLIDPHDPSALGDAMVRLAQDGTLREWLRLAGRQHVKQYDWARIAEQTLRVYVHCCR